MAKFWAVFFSGWAIAGVVLFAISPAMGWWFPGAGDATSTIGVRIDHLFYVILVATAIAFVGTHAVLGYVLWRSGSEPATQAALFTHGNHKLEIIWTVIPGIVLLFIAIYQMDVWAEFRMKNYFPDGVKPIAEVTARQFEWRIRYPAVGKDLTPRPQPGDLYSVNDLRVPFGGPVAVNLRSDDVQHSFFVPEMRIKQDAVPGLVIPVWFQATRTGNFTLLCAELCGWGHYKMKAQLVVQDSGEFDAWKQQLTKDQGFDGTSAEPGAAQASISPGHTD